MTLLARVRLGAVCALLAVLLAACSIGGSKHATATIAPTAAQTPPPAAAASPSGVTTTLAAAPTATATAASTAASNASPTVAEPSPLATDLTGAIRAVVDRVKPAVVQITNMQTQLDQFNQPFTVPAGVGSGVIYDNQGHILTNNHVVAGAQQLQVSLPDGRTFPGKLVGTDPETDVAVVQIQADNLPVAQLGDARALQVGDWVVAIGNALALPGGPTVTVGVVSALGRSAQEPDENGGAGPVLFDLIQTDAPINPGNSGGPLLNLAGQVVGLNTLGAGEAEPGVQAQGIGFAISIGTVKPIADQLITNGSVTHAFLGIQATALTPSIAAQIGTSAKSGVVVVNVVSGSPAEQAGLQAQDVITAADGTQLSDETALAQIISRHKPGDTLTLTIVRGSQQSTVQATLGALPATPTAP
jgi:S1-C subfamily serine protease